MDSAAAKTAVDFSNPADDQRATCKCGKEIRWSVPAKKWFHIHNFMTFCTGRAIDEQHNDEPKAEPYLHLVTNLIP